MMPKSIAYDSDAQAFITATGISGTNATAINQLVIDLKNASIWTKMKAVYPIIGGTATSHKYNLINPADTNAAYRLVFSGGLTHSSSGVLGGGVNGLADTFLDPTTALTQTNCHISANIYTNTFTGSSKVHILSDNSSTPMGLLAVSSTSERSSMGSTILNTTVTASTHRGFWATSRNSTGTNGVSYLIALGTILNYTSSSSFASANIKLFGATSGAAGYSNFGYSFFTIGDALTNTELTALKTAQTTYQTTLARI